MAAENPRWSPVLLLYDALLFRGNSLDWIGSGTAASEHDGRFKTLGLITIVLDVRKLRLDDEAVGVSMNHDLLLEAPR